MGDQSRGDRVTRNNPGRRRMVEKKENERESWRKDRDLLLSANLFTRRRKGGEKNTFMRWNNDIIDGEKGNETRTEIERSYSRFPGG